MAPSLGILGLVAAQKASTADTIIGLVFLLAVLAGGAWSIRALVRRRRGWNALTPEEQEHRKAIRAADKSVKRATRDHKRAISDARSELERAIKPQKLGRFNGVLLHDENIKTRHGRELRRPLRALSARSINMTVTLLGAILDAAIDDDELGPLIPRNGARGRRVRERAPSRTYLDAAAHLAALLDAAGELDRDAPRDRRHVQRRTMLATLAFAGLRISSCWGCAGGTSTTPAAG